VTAATDPLAGFDDRYMACLAAVADHLIPEAHGMPSAGVVVDQARLQFVLGARPDRTYRLDAPAVTIVLSGPVDQLDQLDVDDLVVDVPVGDLEVGDNEVVPTVRVPRGLSVARLVPETVRVSVGALS